MSKLLLSILFLFGVLGFGLLAHVVDPRPAPVTLLNIYSKLTYTVFQRSSESNTQDFVNQTISAATSKPDLASSAIWDDKVIPLTKQTKPEIFAQVLPASVGGGEKWIDVNLTTQTLEAKEGDDVIYTMKVSSGKPWTPTPTGDYRIWIKLKVTRMKGGSKETGDYYDLPNVHNTMYFYKGYGLHEAYWHNNFGHPMSHGCINLSLADSDLLFNWAGPVMADGVSVQRPTDDNPGTRVVVHL